MILYSVIIYSFFPFQLFYLFKALPWFLKHLLCLIFTLQLCSTEDSWGPFAIIFFKYYFGAGKTKNERRTSIKVLDSLYFFNTKSIFWEIDGSVEKWKRHNNKMLWKTIAGDTTVRRSVFLQKVIVDQWDFFFVYETV